MTILQRIRGFFITLGQSCYNMELYRRVRTGPWTRAFIYAIAFFALLSVMLTISAAPGSYKLLGDLESGINESVPDGAEFEIKDGKFSSTLTPGTEFGSEEEFVLVVDDGVYGKEFPKAFEDRIGIFIGRDAIFAQEDDGSREIMPLEGGPDVKVTKENALGWITKFGAVIVTVLLILFLSLHFSLSLLGAVVYVAVTALLTMILGKLWKVRLPYKKWFAIGLHAITLPTLIDYLFSIIGLDVPFAFTVVFFMFMFSVIADERARPVGGVGKGAEGAEAGEESGDSGGAASGR
ncbi:MAG: DUF1189 family protein [Patescibacteria group bacterium]|nr:DUF1189 family protein [Patescibacteria group bacterium]